MGIQQFGLLLRGNAHNNVGLMLHIILWTVGLGYNPNHPDSRYLNQNIYDRQIAILNLLLVTKHLNSWFSGSGICS